MRSDMRRLIQEVDLSSLNTKSDANLGLPNMGKLSPSGLAFHKASTTGIKLNPQNWPRI